VILSLVAIHPTSRGRGTLVEAALSLFVLVVVLLLLVSSLVLSIAANSRSRRVLELTRRVERLEALVCEVRPARPLGITGSGFGAGRAS
jgi:uncharacterized BrkB/YihY/UPF0761 family membrane protein